MYVKEIVRTTKIQDLFSVKDKVVLIGGAGGLGSYLAKGFLDNGAYVILADNAAGKAESVRAKLAADGVSDACACKSQDHFQRATAQKKSKCTTGQCRSQSQGCRGIKPVDPLDLI